jgi:autotransporter-associated beta strand protein
MVYRGGATSPAGVGAATLWKAGPGTLTLGLNQSISTYGAGITSPSLSYDKLWVSGGGTVAISSGNSIPDSGGSLPDAFMLDNGTLRINTVSTTSLGAAGASTFTLTSSTTNVRGITVGPGGGTIEVVNPYEIVFEQINNAEVTGADLIHGSGDLTKTGPGFFRLGIGNTFTGNWIVKQGALQFQRDKSLGADTGTFASNRVTIDGGMLQSNGSGIIGANYGIYVGPNGGRLNAQFVINSKVSGPGTIERVGGQNTTEFNAADNTFGGIRVTNGSVYFNANNSAGVGTIVMDPLFQVGLGKNEGPDNTIGNPIQLNDGALIDLRATSDISAVPESPFNGVQTGSLTLAGKISGTGRLFKGLTAADGARALDGTVVLANGGNDFTGALTVSLGTVEVTASGALGSTNGATVVNNLGTLAFRNVNYTAAEPLAVTGAGKGGLGAIRGVAGNSTFAGPVSLMSDTTIGVDTGAQLNLSGTMQGASAVTKLGGGKLTLSGAGNTWTGDTTLQEGSLDFASNHHIGRLALRSGVTATLTTGKRLLRTTSVDFSSPSFPDATLDLTDGRLIVDYPDNSSTPIAQVRDQIISGYNSAGVTHWNGLGITSTTAAGKSNLGVGYAEATEIVPTGTTTWLGEGNIDTSAVLVRTTLYGDANLDGATDFLDLAKLAQNYNTTVKDNSDSWWTRGDFNYDGNVDFLDLALLAQNYNTALPSQAIPGASAAFEADLARAFASVPEPGTLGLMSAAALALLTRRRRRGA